MTIIQQEGRTIETHLSIDEVVRAIRFLLKERERVRLNGKKRRQAEREANPLPPKEKNPPKTYYIPTGRPRGRPKKNTTTSITTDTPVTE